MTAAFTRAARAIILGSYQASDAEEVSELGDQEIVVTPDRVVLGAGVEDWLLAPPHLPIHIGSYRCDVLLCSRWPLGPAQTLHVEYHFGLVALGLGPVSAFQGLIRKEVHNAEFVVVADRPAVLIPGALTHPIYPQFQRDGIYWSTHALPGQPVPITAEAWKAIQRPASPAEVDACRSRQYMAGVA